MFIVQCSGLKTQKPDFPNPLSVGCSVFSFHSIAKSYQLKHIHASHLVVASYLIMIIYVLHFNHQRQRNENYDKSDNNEMLSTLD